MNTYAKTERTELADGTKLLTKAGGSVFLNPFKGWLQRQFVLRAFGRPSAFRRGTDTQHVIERA